jgi:ABC-type multidrug transport system ATPase subunit
MTDPPPLHALGVSRNFEKFQALSPTDLIIHTGEITILTGPNGAGKTTLLHCLSGLLTPSSGTVSIAGHDLYAEERQAKRDLAFVPDVPRFYTELTAWEHLQFVALAHDASQDFAKRAGTLLRKFGLWDARNLYPHNYSRGMRLKLGLLFALIRPVKTLLLDEPTSALDGESTSMLLSSLEALRAQGAGVLLSTHDADVARSIADRRLEMRDGRLEEA